MVEVMGVGYGSGVEATGAWGAVGGAGTAGAVGAAGEAGVAAAVFASRGVVLRRNQDIAGTSSV